MALSISALIVAVAGVGQAVLPEPDVRFALIAGIPANVARMLLLLGSAVYSRYTYRYEHRQETRQRSRQRLGMLMLQLLEQTGGGCSPGRGRGAHHGAILASPQVRALASVSSSSVLRARRAALMARRRCGVSYPAICMQVLTTARRWMRRSPTSKLARFVKWRRELICYSPNEVDDHLMTTDDDF